MSRCHIVRQLSSISCLLMIATGALQQAQSETVVYEPQVGQHGKDVAWIPTAQALADKMLNLANVTPHDYVIDLGSGDGRIVITAAKRGARALGVEYNPDLVALSRHNAIKAGVNDKVQFIQRDLFESDFSEATVITMFLLPSINLKLRPKILDLKPGTRIVSNTFHMDDWKADQIIVLKREEGCDDDNCPAYLWIVPAKVEGTWNLRQGKLTFLQRFQRIFGELQSGTKTLPVADGKLNGDQISFTIGNEHYTGRVNGNTMQGIVKAAGKASDWVANRIDNKLLSVQSIKDSLHLSSHPSDKIRRYSPFHVVGFPLTFKTVLFYDTARSSNILSESGCFFRSPEQP